ncbi:MAG: NAD(P)-dependent oxidoreductase [Candidatus Firestonebacteria bacterium]
MKIMLTGGSGFIGKNFIETLGKKYEILAPTHKEIELIDEEAVDNYFKNKKFDVVIHSAVRPGHRAVKDSSNQLYNNTRMFFNLVRNSDKYNKMIFLSSGLVYDIRFYQPRMKEEYFGTHIPVDEGGFSKYIISKYIEKTDNILDLRPFSVFGKYENYTIRFISNAICKTLFNLPITIKQNRKFDFIFIDDLVKVIDYFIQNEQKFKSYNVSPDKTIELYEIAKMVKKISEKDIKIIVKEKGMGVEYSGDNTRLKNEIKSMKFNSIDESIKKLYNWYKENANLIKKEDLLYDK